MTRVLVEPRSCDRGLRKHDASTLSATLPTKSRLGQIFFNRVDFLVVSWNDLIFARTLDRKSQFNFLNLIGQQKVKFFTVRSIFFFIGAMKSIFCNFHSFFYSSPISSNGQARCQISAVGVFGCVWERSPRRSGILQE